MNILVIKIDDENFKTSALYKYGPLIFYSENPMYVLDFSGVFSNVSIVKSIELSTTEDVKVLFKNSDISYKVIYETKKEIRLFESIGRRIRERIKKIFNSNS